MAEGAGMNDKNNRRMQRMGCRPVRYGRPWSEGKHIAWFCAVHQRFMYLNSLLCK